MTNNAETVKRTAGHTSTPWKCSPGLEAGSVTVRAVVTDANGLMAKPVAEIWHNGDDPLDNAAFIVLAVNSHQALVDALRGASVFVRQHYAPAIDSEHDLVVSINAALALAGERE